MQQIDEVLQNTFLNNTLWNYLIAFGLIILGAMVVEIVKFVVLRRMDAAERKSLEKGEMLRPIVSFVKRSIRGTIIPILYLGTIYQGLHQLRLGDGLSRFLESVAIIIFTLLAVRFLTSLITFILHSRFVDGNESLSQAGAIKAITPIITGILWGLGIVFLLDNLGFQISTLVAGLGITGIAVALAAQSVLGDLFSYFAILIDRPFEIGDFIIVDDMMGSVEHIGLKTTRIRSLWGEQLVFPNTNLTGSRVKNYKRMQRRRIAFKFGVTYASKPEQLREVPALTNRIVSSVPLATFDRCHFFSFGDSSLDFETVYYVEDPDFNKYMDIQQEICLALKREIEAMGLSFAFPSRSIYVGGRHQRPCSRHAEGSIGKSRITAASRNSAFGFAVRVGSILKGRALIEGDDFGIARFLKGFRT